MGFSLKKAVSSFGSLAGMAGGAILGGPSGAIAGGLGADAVLGAVGLGSDAMAAEQQWKYQKKAADYAYNQNLQMWNLANAYNDPASQMERLQRAGLNPNLVYGGGNVTGNSSASIPSYDTPNVNYTDRSTQRQQLAMALIDHQQRITNQAIENDLARQRLVLQERDANRADALAQAQIRAYAANLGLTGARINDIYYHQEQPQSWLGKHVSDVYKGGKEVYNYLKKAVNSDYKGDNAIFHMYDEYL